MKESTRYRELILMFNRTLEQMIYDKDILNEERRRLILIQEFIKTIYQSNDIQYNRAYMFMRMKHFKEKL